MNILANIKKMTQPELLEWFQTFIKEMDLDFKQLQAFSHVLYVQTEIVRKKVSLSEALLLCPPVDEYDRPPFSRIDAGRWTMELKRKGMSLHQGEGDWDTIATEMRRIYEKGKKMRELHWDSERDQ